jgi:predicted N-acetyltransferase YhbS
MSDPDADVKRVIENLRLPDGVRLRPWSEGDVPAVQELSRREGWPTPSERPAASLRSWQRSWPALVAVSGEEVIGFVRALSDGAVTIYVAEILVVFEWRGRGIGRSLLDAVQLLAPGSRIDLLATTDSSGFYERNGFRSFPGYRRSWTELSRETGW